MFVNNRSVDPSSNYRVTTIFLQHFVSALFHFAQLFLVIVSIWHSNRISPFLSTSLLDDPAGNDQHPSSNSSSKKKRRSYAARLDPTRETISSLKQIHQQSYRNAVSFVFVESPLTLRNFKPQKYRKRVRFNDRNMQENAEILSVQLPVEQHVEASET